MRLIASQNDMSDSDCGQIIEWLSKEFEWLAPLRSDAYRTPEERHNAIWRTPIANQQLTKGRGWIQAEASFGNAYRALVSSESQRLPRQLGETENDTDTYFEHAMSVSNGKRPFNTSRGYIGLGPPQVQQDDIIAILYGANVPFLLRPCGDNRHELVGEAYVHGIMYGEYLEDNAHTEVFELE
jgi:hypothetical protein